jgi:hypothetical protein
MTTTARTRAQISLNRNATFERNIVMTEPDRFVWQYGDGDHDLAQVRGLSGILSLCCRPSEMDLFNRTRLNATANCLRRSHDPAHQQQFPYQTQAEGEPIVGSQTA